MKLGKSQEQAHTRIEIARAYLESTQMPKDKGKKEIKKPKKNKVVA